MGFLTVLGRRRPAGGAAPVVLDTSAMGLVGRWKASEGLLVGSNLVEVSSTPSTTPNGADAKAWSAAAGPYIRFDASAALNSQPFYFGAVAKLTDASGEVLSAGQKVYARTGGSGAMTARIPSAATRTYNNDSEAFGTWQAFIWLWSGGDSTLVYDGKTFTPDLSPGTSGFFLDDIFMGGGNNPIEAAEFWVGTAPANFAEYAASAYGVGNG